ncbi:hypothetical protein ACH4SK_09205 [Streptomyces inhibens]|uniref:hypothetical protein n=1 Tax=Streptomyces inhibens TaxID=2293571 RepID=UPI003793A928
MSEPQAVTRLLPWVSPDGKTCFLVSDGKGEGGLSRVADRVEAVQLDMAYGLLDHAAGMLGDSKLPERELRFLGCQLSAALREVCRLAESRRARLPESESESECDGFEAERGEGGRPGVK